MNQDYPTGLLKSKSGEVKSRDEPASLKARTNSRSLGQHANFISLSRLKTYMPKGLSPLDSHRSVPDIRNNLEPEHFSISRKLSEQANTSRDNLRLNDPRSFRCSRANQFLAAGLNQSAMVSAESHLDHLNHYYIAGNSTNLGMSHQHQQMNHHHYAYNGQSTGAIQNHQHHHLSSAGISNHDQSPTTTYNQIAAQHHQQQHQHQHQQQQQHQHQQHHNHHHQQVVQQQAAAAAAAAAGHQSIYHQMATTNNVANVGVISGTNGNQTYLTNSNSTNHYQSHLQSTSNQPNSLLTDAHQNHLNSAAAAAVMTQTLKTVANQHNQNLQHHQYGGGSISEDFANNAAGTVGMASNQHTQFHGVATIGHQHHQLIGQSQAGGGGGVGIGIPTIHHTQNQHTHQSQNQTPNIPIHQTNSIVTRKYQCKMCPQVFMSKAEMKYHNQNHLREAKPYKCLQCPKAFANSSYLSQHMRIHQGLKPYTCDICTRKFTQLSHLQQHKRTHTGDKPYKCNYMNCTKQFSQLSNLQSHSRCHQLDKPYKCNSCYKCFHDEPSLLEHIPRHLESKHLKRNLCIFCGSSYQQERGLVKHFQQYHTDKTPTLVAAAIAAGTTGNTSLIASLVSTSTKSSQAKFLTPSTGSISSTGISSSTGNSLIRPTETGNGVGVSTGISGDRIIKLGASGHGAGHNNNNISNANNDQLTTVSSDTSRGVNLISGSYQIAPGFI